MPATKVQLTGGSFQDSEGNLLALGYLVMKLAQDANISGVGNIAAGIEIRIQLDSNGSVVTSPAQSVWGVDQMLPPNNYYRVTGYTAAGQPSWGPNNQQVVGSGGTFDVGTWVPNQVISWTPPPNTTTLFSGSISSVSGTTVSFSYSMTLPSTPKVFVVPRTNAGSFYISASDGSGFTITYETSGAQTFDYIVFA